MASGPKSTKGGGGKGLRQGRLTDLSRERIARREAGEKPLCNSPLVGQGGKPNPKRCKQPAGSGTDHYGFGSCSRHAGLMKSAKVTAAREAVAVEVIEYKRFYGVKGEISFEEGLVEEFQRSVGVVRWIEEKLAKWDPGQEQDEVLSWDEGTGLPKLLEVHHGFRSVTIADTEHAAWMRQFLLERQHLARVAKMGIDAGIAKGILQVYQRQAEMLNAIIRETLKRLGVGGDDRLPQILPEVIREVTARSA